MKKSLAPWGLCVAALAAVTLFTACPGGSEDDTPSPSPSATTSPEPEESPETSPGQSDKNEVLPERLMVGLPSSLKSDESSSLRRLSGIKGLNRQRDSTPEATIVTAESAYGQMIGQIDNLKNFLFVLSMYTTYMDAAISQNQLSPDTGVHSGLTLEVTDLINQRIADQAEAIGIEAEAGDVGSFDLPSISYVSQDGVYGYKLSFVDDYGQTITMEWNADRDKIKMTIEQDGVQVDIAYDDALLAAVCNIEMDGLLSTSTLKTDSSSLSGLCGLYLTYDLSVDFDGTSTKFNIVGYADDNGGRIDATVFLSYDGYNDMGQVSAYFDQNGSLLSEANDSYDEKTEACVEELAEASSLSQESGLDCSYETLDLSGASVGVCYNVFAGAFSGTAGQAYGVDELASLDMANLIGSAYAPSEGVLQVSYADPATQGESGNRYVYALSTDGDDKIIFTLLGQY